jgi:site-specific DNA-methyltransferase (adenine-specific)
MKPNAESSNAYTPTEMTTRTFKGIHGTATLILGDCLKMLPIAADAVISDPPYGIAHKRGKCADRGKGVTLGASEIIDDAEPFDPSPWLSYPIAVLWGANWYADKLPPGRWLVWDKQEHGGSGDFSEAELAWQNRMGAIKVFRHMWLGVQRASQVGESLLHPTQKPVPLMAWCMEMAKVPAGATVLDPYMGSGTTGIACLRTGRNFLGIELDPKHYETACERLAREIDGQLI